MRITTALKSLSLIGLAIGSSVITSMLLPAQRTTQASDVAPAKGTGSTTATMVAGAAMDAGVVQPIGPTTIANGSMRELRIEVQGKTASIQAQAALRDMRPDSTYVWSFRLLDTDRTNVLFEHRYDDQQFQVNPGQFYEPTFDDVIDVPVTPGKYIAEVLLYRVPFEGVNALNDSKPNHSAIGPSGRTEVAIKF